MAADLPAVLPNPHQVDRPFLLVHFPNIQKLTSTNYLAWSNQIQLTLEGYDLYNYLNGSFPSPPETIPGNNNQQIANPAYLTWKRQDRLIHGALVGTLSASVQSLVTRATSSKAAWDLLKTTYATASRGHKQQIRQKLRTFKKGTRPVSEYMQIMKAYADLLASLDAPLSQEDFTDYLLRGLDATFQSVIDGVQNRDTPISFEELHEKLIVKELAIQIESQSESSTDRHPTSALTAQAKSNKGKSKGTSSQSTPGWSPYTPQPRQPILPTPPPTSAPPQKPFKGHCQFCLQKGHVLTHCPEVRRRFPNFPVPNSARFPAAPQANIAASSSNQHWLVDSGATNIVTNDLSALRLHYPYDGPDTLHIGDGSGQNGDNPS